MQAQQLERLNTLAPGEPLGELRLTPTRSQLFMFSAVTWNRHQIHFDKDQAASEGFRDVAVQRGLIGNFLARLMTRWAGTGGRLERLNWKVTQSAFPGEELRCLGTVIKVVRFRDVTKVNCALRVLRHNNVTIANGDSRTSFALGANDDGGIGNARK